MLFIAFCIKCCDVQINFYQFHYFSSFGPFNIVLFILSQFKIYFKINYFYVVSISVNILLLSFILKYFVMSDLKRCFTNKLYFMKHTWKTVNKDMENVYSP